MSFYALKVSFEQIFYAFAKEPDKLFWARLKEKTFAFAGKWLEHLESRKILCVHPPKILTVSVGPGYKILREWIRCLYNNVIDRLCVVTIQSTIDQREQTLHLDTSQLVLKQVQLCAKRSYLHYVTGRLEENNVSVL